MEWQAIGFALQILLLTVGWALFQKARSELSARAVEAPVLSELKNLQRNVRQLIEQLEEASLEASARLERGCSEARELLAILDHHLKRWEEVEACSTKPTFSTVPQRPSAEERCESTNAALLWKQAAKVPSRKEQVYALARQGASPASIAREVGISEGEVETLLGLQQADR